MSLSNIKKVMENLENCSAWSLQLLRFVNSKRNGTQYGGEADYTPRVFCCSSRNWGKKRMLISWMSLSWEWAILILIPTFVL